MKTCRVELVLKANVLTPFQADTIFGHLCWVVAHHEGNKALEEFLEPFKTATPPFLISDGFPGELFPKPFSADFNLPETMDRGRMKDLKKTTLISREDFDSIRAGDKIVPARSVASDTAIITPHNTINRLTNTTPPEGGVFSLEETFSPTISLYLKAVSDTWKDRVVSLLGELSKIGYGKKKSIGKGHFSVGKVSEFRFEPVPDPDGFVTLSNFCPAENDPADGLYRTFVKYGKLGEEFTFSGNPFKHPLLMIKAGSVFKTSGPPREFYGRMVEGIAPAEPKVCQYAYAFAVPMRVMV
jgi:CRISPR-associated protein Csm4